MPADTSNLFLLQDLEDPSRTSRLADSDLNALRTVADWIKTFVASPNKDLGRAGPVCPFVPGALERKTLWLAPEHLSDRSVPDVAELMNGYRSTTPAGSTHRGRRRELQSARRRFHRLVGGTRKRIRGRRPNTESQETLLCGRRSRVGRVPREERGVCDSQPELSTLQVTRTVLAHEACGRQRLDVLPGQRRLAKLLVASLWRVRSPGSC